MREKSYTDQISDIAYNSKELLYLDRGTNVSDTAYHLLVRMIKDRIIEVVDGKLWPVNHVSVPLTTGEAHIISCIVKAISDISGEE